RVSCQFGMALNVPPEPYIWLRAIIAPRRDDVRTEPMVEDLIPLGLDEANPTIEVVDGDDVGCTKEYQAWWAGHRW
ncbi:hypothetical protein KI387_044611, partial [Taxus chinensis]